MDESLKPVRAWGVPNLLIFDAENGKWTSKIFAVCDLFRLTQLHSQCEAFVGECEYTLGNYLA